MILDHLFDYQQCERANRVKREAYANDQGAAASLVAVTARTNRSKADQDPAQWLPPATDQYCRSIGEWIGAKLR